MWLGVRMMKRDLVKRTGVSGEVGEKGKQKVGVKFGMLKGRRVHQRRPLSAFLQYHTLPGTAQQINGTEGSYMPMTSD